MNLHNLPCATRRWLWLNASGANGASIGIHLWQLDEGIPPPFAARPAWASTMRYWTPDRFSWTPFAQAIRDLRERAHTIGWQRPLCGARSRSTAPRIYAAGRDNNACGECLRVAYSRGIIPATHETADYQSTQRQRLAEEYTRWQQAGRPNQEWAG